MAERFASVISFFANVAFFAAKNSSAADTAAIQWFERAFHVPKFMKASAASDQRERILAFRAGAKPHGQKDKVLLPKKLILALHTSNQEPTLSARIGSGASPPARLITNY